MINIPTNLDINDIESIMKAYEESSMSDEAIGKVILLFNMVHKFLSITEYSNTTKSHIARQIEALNQCVEYRNRTSERIKDYENQSSSQTTRN